MYNALLWVVCYGVRCIMACGVLLCVVHYGVSGALWCVVRHGVSGVLWCVVHYDVSGGGMV